ncbi:MAG: hypothetical protein MI919_00805 [Holophagales bacterium]|nr:hypothetical protein [Holophagales bacterium]
MTDSGAGLDDPVAIAIRQLSEALRREAARHPLGYLAERPGTQLEISLEVPFDHPGQADPSRLAERAAAARSVLRAELEALLTHRAIFRPGRVPSLRTGKAEGKETAPPDSRFVFGGWSPTGVPRFFDFAQWLLQLDHPDQDRLYARPPGLVTAFTPQQHLLAEVLPDFRETPTDFRVHGQVAAGWWRVPRADGTPATLALTFQAVSSVRGTGSRRRFGLNVLGRGPDGEPFEELVARLEAHPWEAPVAWAREALDTLERARGGKNGDTRGVDERITGILKGLARRLEQKRRSRDRRTGHAEARHRSGERPTRMAMEDLARAADEDVLVDERQGTLVVLGQRGRTHLFNPEGKLVTSVRYSPEAVEKKKRAGIWRPAEAAEAERLRNGAGLSDTASERPLSRE